MQEWRILGDVFVIACLASNLGAMLAGYFSPRLFGLHVRQAIAMDIGLHNAILAIFIALYVLRSPPMSIVPTITV